MEALSISKSEERKDPLSPRISEALNQSIALKQLVLKDSLLLSNLDRIVDAACLSLRNQGTLYFCGNGGSAADAQHLAAELSGRFYYDRPALSAEALHANTSFITAIANDYSYDEIFSRAVASRGRKGDLLIGLSTSGNSKNVVKAFEVANAMGLITISFTGEGGGAMKDLARYSIRVPSKDTPRIQEVHILLGHIVCELIEAKIFPKMN